jgi:hypothetical protein
MSDVLLQHRGTGNLFATVRTLQGIFSAEYRSGKWMCSCGAGSAGCSHVEAVALALLPALRGTDS